MQRSICILALLALCQLSLPADARMSSLGLREHLQHSALERPAEQPTTTSLGPRRLMAKVSSPQSAGSPPPPTPPPPSPPSPPPPSPPSPPPPSPPSPPSPSPPPPSPIPPPPSPEVVAAPSPAVDVALPSPSPNPLAAFELGDTAAAPSPAVEVPVIIEATPSPSAGPPLPSAEVSAPPPTSEPLSPPPSPVEAPLSPPPSLLAPPPSPASLPPAPEDSTVAISTEKLQQKYTSCPLVAVGGPNGLYSCDTIAQGLPCGDELTAVYQACEGVYDCAPLKAAYQECINPPPVQIPAPVVQTPAPEVQTPAPEVQTPAPEVQTPAPVVQTPAPVVQTPAPVVQTPAPVVQTPAPETKKTPAPAPETKAPVSNGCPYVIKAGETLPGIAAKYGTDLATILALNPQIVDPNNVIKGQGILLPICVPAEASTQSASVATTKSSTPAPETKTPAPAPETKSAPAPETKSAPAPETKSTPVPKPKTPAPAADPTPAPASTTPATVTREVNDPSKQEPTPTPAGNAGPNPAGDGIIWGNFASQGAAGGTGSAFATYHYYSPYYYTSSLYCADAFAATLAAGRGKDLLQYPWTAYCNINGLGPMTPDKCGKHLKVTNPTTGQSVITTVVDMCGQGGVDMDPIAFNAIDGNGAGVRDGHMWVKLEWV